MLVTIGVSVRPQPNVEMYTDAPELLRRIELGVVLPEHWGDDAVKRFGSYLSGQSRLPWREYSWLGSGHTVPCDSWQNRDYTYALLLLEHARAPRLSLGSVFGDPVNVLWFLPISEKERQRAMDTGSEFLMASLPSQRWADS